MDNGQKTIFYDYTPDGRKLKCSHSTALWPMRPRSNFTPIMTTTTDTYIDGLILRDGVPLMWQFDGGYISLDDNGNPSSWNYYITDHLGSTRMVVTNTNTIKETINYYPYGSEMRLTNPAQMVIESNKERFRFSGKELDFQNGLNMYDFGARLFDVAGVPIWTSVDPLAEKNYKTNPYLYCNGDPVNRFDPDGMDWYQNEDGTSAFWQDSSNETITVGDILYKNVGSSFSINYELGDFTYTLSFEQNVLESSSIPIGRIFDDMGDNGNGLIDYTSSLLSNSSTFFTEYAKLGYNTDFNYWKSAKGKIYSFSILQKQENGKFIKGVQGYRNSYNWASAKFDRINNIGKGLGYADITLNGVQFAVSPSSENGWKLIDSAVSIFNPILNTLGSVLLTPFFIEQNHFSPYNQENLVR